MKRALITGITGQDGAYLAEFLINKGYQVHGIRRRTSLHNTQRIDHLVHRYPGLLILHYGDVTDTSNITRLIGSILPDEIYNLAAQSHVGVSFETPEYTANADALGALRVLEAVRVLGLSKATKVYQASTSEMYGNVRPPQNEKTSLEPCSPYGIAKLYAYWTTINYREAYGMFAVNGILFNHESPYRSETFVSRKITKTLVAIAQGSQEILYLGNIDTARDWGYAPDYVRAMWLMLQHPHPEDFVIATGQTHTVKEFIDKACTILNISLIWHKQDNQYRAYDAHTARLVIATNTQLVRPTDIYTLQGDASKARLLLGWQPTVSFEQLIELMLHHDLKTHHTISERVVHASV